MIPPIIGRECLDIPGRVVCPFWTFYQHGRIVEELPHSAHFVYMFRPFEVFRGIPRVDCAWKALKKLFSIFIRTLICDKESRR